jgi:poly-gamma-glutamate synthesis protein (capsule biosynthesis protein)
MTSSFSHAIVTLFLCGDVMTGRGIDQILPHPAPPQLFEPYVRDARRYVQLADRVNGPIRRPVDFAYVWGDALAELQRRRPEVKLINLETSLTAAGEPWPGKGIHYRMHPANVPLLTVAGIDVAALANNHVLDWGYAGLAQTLATLQQAGILTTGAGRNYSEAEIPAVVELAGKGRVLVFACGVASSGIPGTWGAAAERAGVNLLPELSAAAVDRIGAQVQKVKRPGDVVVASLHWGGNWGYDIAPGQRQFAHELLDRAGVDLVHGHSSHHVQGIEVYRGKLILYGCGDLLSDYEGIGTEEEFRSDLGLLYFVRIDPGTGQLVGLELVPMQTRQFRLGRAAKADVLWLRDTLNREGERFGTRVEMPEDDTLVLRWQEE